MSPTGCDGDRSETWDLEGIGEPQEFEQLMAIDRELAVQVDGAGSPREHRCAEEHGAGAHQLVVDADPQDDVVLECRGPEGAERIQRGSEPRVGKLLRRPCLESRKVELDQAAVKLGDP
jgi:hypothetical protein